MTKLCDMIRHQIATNGTPAEEEIMKHWLILAEELELTLEVYKRKARRFYKADGTYEEFETEEEVVEYRKRCAALITRQQAALSETDSLLAKYREVYGDDVLNRFERAKLIADLPITTSGLAKILVQLALHDCALNVAGCYNDVSKRITNILDKLEENNNGQND